MSHWQDMTLKKRSLIKQPQRAPLTQSHDSHPTPSLSQATIQRALANPRALAPNDILQLQNTIGNQAVQRMLQRESQEGFEADDEFEGQLKRTKGGGSPLPQNIKSEFEQSLGSDLSNVRIHTNAASNQLNRSIQAQAFTHGNHIHFDAGEYNPATSKGKQLLAHELTHTVQQTGGKQSKGVQTKLQVGAANDRYEQEADSVANQVTAGSGQAPASIQPERGAQAAGMGPNTIQRKTRNLEVAPRLSSSLRKVGYTKSVETKLNVLVDDMKLYNAIPMDDKDYDAQLVLLRKIAKEAKDILSVIESFQWLNKGGTFRSLGGPFRLGYYHLIRKLKQVGGSRLSKDMDTKDHEAYMGEAEHEIDDVYKQQNTNPWEMSPEARERDKNKHPENYELPNPREQRQMDSDFDFMQVRLNHAMGNIQEGKARLKAQDKARAGDIPDDFGAMEVIMNSHMSLFDDVEPVDLGSPYEKLSSTAPTSAPAPMSTTDAPKKSSVFDSDQSPYVAPQWPEPFDMKEVDNLFKAQPSGTKGGKGKNKTSWKSKLKSKLFGKG